jgi:hypothetical protein
MLQANENRNKRVLAPGLRKLVVFVFRREWFCLFVELHYMIWKLVQTKSSKVNENIPLQIQILSKLFHTFICISLLTQKWFHLNDVCRLFLIFSAAIGYHYQLRIIIFHCVCVRVRAPEHRSIPSIKELSEV